MKKLLSFYVLLISCFYWENSIANCNYLPSVQFYFPSGIPSTILLGQTIHVPMTMNYQHLRKYKTWFSPVELQNVSGSCPALVGDTLNWHANTCHMRLVIRGKNINEVITGPIKYRVTGHTDNNKPFAPMFETTRFQIKVLPNPLSMNLLQQQDATAGKTFQYQFNERSVKHYDENKAAGTPAEGLMDAANLNALHQLGLNFDPKQFVITGVPNRIGTFSFQIGARNSYSTAAPTTLTINVHENPEDKPVFKSEMTQLLSATPGKSYHLNLMSLIKDNPTFMKTNQIYFTLEGFPHPKWLEIKPEEPTILVGKPDKSMAGQTAHATLTAISNTGGTSAPFPIMIPIAFDPEQKPIIEPFQLHLLAGSSLYADVARHIKNATNDPSLTVTLLKTEPEAPWLSLTGSMLEGVAGIELTGQKFMLTLRANTMIGGDSEAVTIPLQIEVDKARTPQFKSANPNLPLMYPGQPYFYDFVANRDIFPEYEDAPYTIEFDENSKHPEWLQIENNRLFSTEVPQEIDLTIEINLVIKNIPGGASRPITLDLWSNLFLH